MTNPRRIGYAAAAIAAAALLIGFRQPLLQFASGLFRPFLVIGTLMGFQKAPADAGLLCKADAIDRSIVFALTEENKQLKSLLSFAERSEQRLMTARIIGRSSNPLVRRVLLDRGAADGVKAGEPAVTGEGILAGVVIETTEFTSTVRLISDRQTKLGVSLLGQTQTIGFARGVQEGLLGVEYILEKDALAQNDLVVTSGLDDAIPSGLLIGVVNAVETGEAQPFQSAIVQPYANSDTETILSILIRP